MNRIFDPTVLRNAASHICYSLSIGFGGMISMASYNPSSHNPYITAATLTVADGIMSLFGGLAVFSILGFMSKQLNVPIDEVIQSGTGLAFVAYPEAMSRLPLPWLWSFLFFVMIWILGISTQFGFVEAICTAIYDQFPATQRHRSLLVYTICFILWCCGILICTRAGIFYFNIFNDYTASFALMVLLFLEIVLVCHIYGIKNYIYDLRSMMGVPKTTLAKWFGPTGYYPAFVWTIICPIVCAIIFVLALATQITHNMTYGKGTRIYVYPNWSIAFGWMLSLIPFIFPPAFVIYNLRKFHQKGLSWRELLRLQPKWPSYTRHQMKGTGGAANSDRIGVADPHESSKDLTKQQTEV
uniref:Uncharacterized protein n=1 Tax=Panagrolaimus sp. PS1159 TaxID=55785 RepID=A0AC35G1G4_9BILA